MKYVAVVKELTFSELTSIALVVIVPLWMLYALVF